MIKLTNVSKYYSSNDVIALGLRKVNLELHVNEFVAIVGESGSGKTTLLNVISGIDTYEDGEMYINGEETSYFSVSDMENYRKKYVAFVFQDYNLIDSYTVLQNVEAPLLLSGYPKNKIKQRALEIIEKVGLKEHAKHKATKLSGGQKQRVVIARALAKDCPIIAADEPTGNLDSASAKQIIKLLADIAKDKLVVMVTHDFNQVAEHATRKIRIYDGEIVEDKELVKVDKKDLPKLEDKEFKMDFLSTIRLSLRNLFAVPKKSFLMLIVFTFFAIFIGLAYGGYIITSQASSYPYNNYFRYANQDRIVVKRFDNSPLTLTDIEQLESFSKVKYVLPRDYVIDNSITVESSLSGLNYMTFSFLPLSLFGDNLQAEYGVLPIENNQVLLAGDSYIFGLGEDVVNQDINELYFGLASEISVYTITGMISNDKIIGSELFDRSYLIVTDETYDILATKYYLGNYGTIELNYGGFLRDLRSNKFVIDNTVPDNKMRVGSNEFNYYCFETCEIESFLSVKDYYVDEEYELGLMIDNTILTNEIFLNQSTYNLIIYDDIYQVSLFTTDDINVPGLVRQIARINMGLTPKYKVVYPYDSAVSSQFEGILLMLANIGMIFLIIVTMVGSTLITYVIFKVIINTKMHDYAIFRTIGANQGVIKKFIYMENFYIVVAAFAIFVAISILVPNNMPQYSVFYAFKVFDIGKYFVYFILLLLMSLFISRKYCNRIFSSSVSKTLKTDLE